MPKLNVKNILFANAPTTDKESNSKFDRALKVLFGLNKGWYKQRDFTKNNFEQGLGHFKQGNVQDAVFRFKLVTWQNKNHADGWYWLGRSLLRDGKKEQALAALQKAQQLKPGQEDTNYMLAVAMGAAAPDNMLPKRLPPSLVKEHFEGIASNYVATIELGKHKGHELVADATRTALLQGRLDHVVLDLGVGTGLCGVRLRNVAAHITGVDISAKMLERAMLAKDDAGKKMYDALVHREAVDFLSGAADAAFDVVLAAGLVDYIGELDEFWKQVARCLNKGGIFALSASSMPDSAFRFDTKTEHFRFSKSYLEGLAGQHGMSVVSCTEADVSLGQMMWICVFRKA